MIRNNRTVAGVVALLVVVLCVGGCSSKNQQTEQSGADGEKSSAEAQTEEKPQLPAPEWPDAEKEITLDLGGGVKMEFVLIPAGEFMMGSHESPEAIVKAFDLPRKSFRYLKSEHPQHRVRITKAFYLGKYEVTQEQWEVVMGDNPSLDNIGPKNPAEGLGWNDCRAFISKLNEKHGSTGLKFSLPTEAQWEYACRAGTTTRYSFGDELASLGEYAWHWRNLGEDPPVPVPTQPVGRKKPNAWGLYDMHGNVDEWCADWYGEDYYEQSPQNDPT